MRHSNKMKTLTLRTSCILAFCRARIPENRQRRNAITCSNAHQKLYRKLRKAERDRRICDKCGRPCTPEEKAEFRKWREEQAKKSGNPAKRVRASANAIKTMAY